MKNLLAAATAGEKNSGWVEAGFCLERFMRRGQEYPCIGKEYPFHLGVKKSTFEFTQNATLCDKSASLWENWASNFPDHFWYELSRESLQYRS
jgi:hypothetical protein